MWEAREPQSIIQAAEKAAEAGSYTSAEKLLREAARLQEASLGPRHPDLANTLNNLGIVCEIIGKPDDAEQYFRRAVSIARTSLAPDHPFVTTSQKNLRDFCDARGKKVDATPEEQPPVQPVEATLDAEPAPAADEAPHLAIEPVPQAAIEPVPQPAIEPVPQPAYEPVPQPAIEPEPENPEVTSKKFFYRMALGALGPIAMLMVILAAGLPRLGAPELAAPVREIAIDSPQPIAPPPITPTPVPAPVDTPTPEETRTTVSTKASSRDADETATSDITPASASSRPVVLRASLCGDLDDWSCDPADRPVPPGPLFFYTQIKSPTATTVQHRWYQDGHLRQAVELRVEANRSAGFRTFSRNLMKSESAGDWRVEVRSQDGALLHEERFSVR
jgi:tetratricopeptide repeat protein/DUF2914 family protein